MTKKMSEQEYEEKSQELMLKTFDMAGRANGAKTQRGYDRYMHKALKAMVDGAKLDKEYKAQQQEQPTEPEADDDYYDDGL